MAELIAAYVSSSHRSRRIESRRVRTQWVGADSILFATAHRPWPAPMAPWIMTQRWNDLLFLHYSLDAGDCPRRWFRTS